MLIVIKDSFNVSKRSEFILIYNCSIKGRAVILGKGQCSPKIMVLKSKVEIIIVGGAFCTYDADRGSIEKHSSAVI